ncbi:unnamed protein product [Lathyrus sativus]|nr:unnamed protein product [Lathyrus sativus]
MPKHNNLTTDETTQNSGTTFTRAPPHRRNKSSVWNNFTPDPDLIGIARCNYCDSKLKSNNGTTSMTGHSKICKSNSNSEANKRLKTTPSSTTNVTSPSAIVLGKFDQEKCRQAVVDMIVEMELPYMHADHKAFRRCMSVLQPRFIPISRSTVARDVLALWDFEREKLKTFLSQHCRSVCLTTNGWTSCQNMTYMCIKAHFIDNNWKLHKKILSFVRVLSHSGEVIVNTFAKCLDNWGLNYVLSVTVDNEASNDRGIENLKKRLRLRNDLVLNGDHFHTRCCAHVMNLVVKKGLKEIDISVSRIRGAVKYVKSSLGREHKFLACVRSRQIEYKGSVQFDCETRWNSTYDMLKAALQLEMAFVELGIIDTKYC